MKGKAVPIIGIICCIVALYVLDQRFSERIVPTIGEAVGNHQQHHNTLLPSLRPRYEIDVSDNGTVVVVRLFSGTKTFPNRAVAFGYFPRCDDDIKTFYGIDPALEQIREWEQLFY